MSSSNAPDVVRVPLEVRYSETDQMGVAYHANYPIWFEVGRTGYMERRGMAYRDVEARGFLLPVAEIWFRVISPARYADRIEVETWVSRLESRRIRLAYRILREEATLARGWTTLMCVGTDFRPRRFPDWFVTGCGAQLGDDPPPDPGAR